MQGEVALGFRDGFVRLNRVPTHVITFGGWVREDMSRYDHKMLILVIPGNPGMIEFYKDFMETIYVTLGMRVPVWGISHSGHVKEPSGVTMPPLHGNETLYGLHAQIEHKISFVENFVPKDYSLILVGHSIGCYISMELMSSVVGAQVSKSVLLFPTIERLALSPQGRWAKQLLNYFQPFAIALLFVLSYLSTRVQYKIVEWYFQNGEGTVPDCALRASMNIFDVSCTRKWMFMAKQEMVIVREPDIENIARHLDDLVFYYGTNDHWCPVAYYEELIERFPDGDIRLCDRGYDHAFVLRSGRDVGSMVAVWLKDMLLEGPE